MTLPPRTPCRGAVGVPPAAPGRPSRCEPLPQLLRRDSPPGGERDREGVLICYVAEISGRGGYGFERSCLVPVKEEKKNLTGWRGIKHCWCV